MEVACVDKPEGETDILACVARFALGVALPDKLAAARPNVARSIRTVAEPAALPLAGVVEALSLEIRAVHGTVGVIGVWAAIDAVTAAAPDAVPLEAACAALLLSKEDPQLTNALMRATDAVSTVTEEVPAEAPPDGVVEALSLVTRVDVAIDATIAAAAAGTA